MLIRWQSLPEFELMRRQMDRFLSEATGLTTDEKDRSWLPASELRDDGDALTLRVVIPDINPQDLDIQVTRNSVSINGERTVTRHGDKESQYFWSEVQYGRFQRVFQLPAPVQNEEVKADYQNGVLVLTLPKTNEVKAFKVSLPTA
jgi:HSP20 family protein